MLLFAFNRSATHAVLYLQCRKKWVPVHLLSKSSGPLAVLFCQNHSFHFLDTNTLPVNLYTGFVSVPVSSRIFSTLISEPYMVLLTLVSLCIHWASQKCLSPILLAHGGCLGPRWECQSTFHIANDYKQAVPLCPPKCTASSSHLVALSRQQTINTFTSPVSLSSTIWRSPALSDDSFISALRLLIDWLNVYPAQSLRGSYAWKYFQDHLYDVSHFLQKPPQKPPFPWSHWSRFLIPFPTEAKSKPM